MIISIYELLGLVKDDKAPKKIKYNDKIFDYNNTDYRFWDEEYECYGYLTSYIGNNSLNILNDEIEILEEQKKIPEKIEFSADGYPIYVSCLDGDDIKHTHANDYDIFIANKINSIIDYLKSKGE